MSHEHDDETRAATGGESEPLEEVGRLPRSIEPERDLWPGIAARLGRPAAAPEPESEPAPEPNRRRRRERSLSGGDGGRQRPWRLWQLAAAAALVAVLAGTGFGLLRLLGPEGAGDPARIAGPAATDPAGTVPSDPAAPDATEPPAAASVPGAGAFGSRLLAALERKRNQLGPETSDAVEADIARLGMAMAEIFTAIAENPDEPALYHHLAARQRQEADLLLRLNQL